MRRFWIKNRIFMIFAAIGLGLGMGSDAAPNDQKSLTSVSLSQANETETAGGVNTNYSDISSFFDMTYFDFDSAKLSAETHKVFDRVVNKFLTNPSGHVVISGHADERGTREYNLAFAHHRVFSIADYMVAERIDG